MQIINAWFKMLLGLGSSSSSSHRMGLSPNVAPRAEAQEEQALMRPGGVQSEDGGNTAPTSAHAQDSLFISRPF